MKTQKKNQLLGIFVIFISSFAYAQVGPCPPGMSEYPSSNGIPSCGPLRSNDDQPNGYWQDQWGTYVVGDDGTTGWSSNQPSESSAKEIAIKNCTTKGGTQCAVSLTYRNACIAVVSGENNGHVASDATIKKAVKRAVNLCKNRGDTNCQLFRAECSPAKWISN